MSNVFLSVIIPAYNEEKRISKTLLAVDEYLARQNYDYEIIVIDDGSKDNTVSVVKNLAKIVRNLRLIENKENKGKGGVTAQGMLLAKGQYRLFMDADNATAVDHFEKMLPHFRSGFDIVIGSRAVEGAKIAVHQPFYKELFGKAGNLVIQAAAVPGIWDTQCGFKAFTARAAEEIFKQLTITRWGFDVEVLALARFLDFKIKEIPVYWINDPLSHVTLKAYVRVFFDTFKVRWNLIIGRYKK